jgi:hypothetical protein
VQNILDDASAVTLDEIAAEHAEADTSTPATDTSTPAPEEA